MADSDSNSPQDLLTFDEDEHTWLPLAEETDAGSKRRRSNGTDDILPEPSMRILMTKLMDAQHIVDKRLTDIPWKCLLQTAVVPSLTAHCEGRT